MERTGRSGARTRILYRRRLPPSPSRRLSVSPLTSSPLKPHQNLPQPPLTPAAYAAQSLLSALGCIQFVSNVIFAGFVLKEKISVSVLTATGCIVGGCVLLVVFGNHASHEYTTQDLLDLYGRPAYIVYLVFSACGVVGGYLAYVRGSVLTAQLGDKVPSYWPPLLPVAYALFSALIGTQSVLFSKTLSTLLRATAGGQNQLKNWFTWVRPPPA